MRKSDRSLNPTEAWRKKEKQREQAKRKLSKQISKSMAKARSDPMSIKHSLDKLKKIERQGGRLSGHQLEQKRKLEHLYNTVTKKHLEKQLIQKGVEKEEQKQKKKTSQPTQQENTGRSIFGSFSSSKYIEQQRYLQNSTEVEEEAEEPTQPTVQYSTDSYPQQEEVSFGPLKPSSDEMSFGPAKPSLSEDISFGPQKPSFNETDDSSFGPPKPSFMQNEESKPKRKVVLKAPSTMIPLALRIRREEAPKKKRTTASLPRSTIEPPAKKINVAPHVDVDYTFGPSKPQELSFGPQRPTTQGLNFGPRRPNEDLNFGPQRPTTQEFNFGPQRPVSQPTQNFGPKIPTTQDLNFGPQRPISQPQKSKKDEEYEAFMKKMANLGAFE